MTQKIEVGIKVGRFTVTELAEPNRKGERRWWVQTPKGTDDIVLESVLLAALEAAEREAELQRKLTPSYIRSLSARAYRELVQEVGEEAVERALNQREPIPEVTDEQKIAIAKVFFAKYPQVERTVENIRALAEWNEDRDVYWKTFTLSDLVAAFQDLAPRGKITIDLRVLIPNPEKRYGFNRVDNYDGIVRLSSEDFQRVMSPVIRRPEDPFESLSSDEVQQAFDAADQKAGVSRPVPPLLEAARNKLLASFFDVHREIENTAENADRLVRFLNEHEIAVNFQGLECAAESLGDQITKVDSGAYHYGGTTWQVNPPRNMAPINPQPSTVEVVDRVKRITRAQVDAMTSEQYLEALKNPAFRKAIDEMDDLGRKK